MSPRSGQNEPLDLVGPHNNRPFRCGLVSAGMAAVRFRLLALLAASICLLIGCGQQGAGAPAPPPDTSASVTTAMADREAVCREALDSRVDMWRGEWERAQASAAANGAAAAAALADAVGAMRSHTVELRLISGTQGCADTSAWVAILTIGMITDGYGSLSAANDPGSEVSRSKALEDIALAESHPEIIECGIYDRCFPAAAQP